MDFFIEAWEILKSSVILTLDYLVNPSKRIHYIYLISSLIIAMLFYLFSQRKEPVVKYFFSKRTWMSRSALTDYFYVFFNSLIKVTLIAPYLIFSLRLAFYMKEFLLSNFGYLDFKLKGAPAIIVYTIVIFLAQDIGTFLIHYLQHRIPVLWHFHKVHHSATSLNPITQYRIHPIELILNNVKSILISGLVIGLFDYLSGERINAYTLMGVNILSFFFLFLGANLRHSSVRLKYPSWLENILISPFQHQIHHSNKVEHFSKNIGSKLAIWDWMFGSLVKSNETKEDVEYGIGEETKFYEGISRSLFRPFINIIVSVINVFKISGKN